MCFTDNILYQTQRYILKTITNMLRVSVYLRQWYPRGLPDWNSHLVFHNPPRGATVLMWLNDHCFFPGNRPVSLLQSQCPFHGIGTTC